MSLKQLILDVAILYGVVSLIVFMLIIAALMLAKKPLPHPESDASVVQSHFSPLGRSSSHRMDGHKVARSEYPVDSFSSSYVCPEPNKYGRNYGSTNNSL